MRRAPELFTDDQIELEVGLTQVHRDAGRALTPKKPSQDKAGWADLFPYYAGFSFDWASSHLKALTTSNQSTILDPWNGSGTTTLAAQAIGCKSVGVDLNPVACVVARARSMRPTSRSLPSIPSTPTRLRSDPPSGDPLGSWLDEHSVGRLRDWISTVSAIGYECRDAALLSGFIAVRRLTKSFEGTNRTWVKTARSSNARISLTDNEVDREFRDSYEFVRNRSLQIPLSDTPSTVVLSSASCLPVRDQSISTILTSPPYLTRIDYAVAYSRELAVLGIGESDFRDLRSRLMGTTRIRSAGDSIVALHPKTAELLDAISKHSSRASSGYYLKQARQYFQDLAVSLQEISRVASLNASMTLVVQDSFYKDIHLPLADIYVFEAARNGWHVEDHQRFPVNRSMTSLNPSAKKYTKSTVTESVIVLRRISLS